MNLKRNEYLFTFKMTHSPFSLPVSIFIWGFLAPSSLSDRGLACLPNAPVATAPIEPTCNDQPASPRQMWVTLPEKKIFQRKEPEHCIIFKLLLLKCLLFLHFLKDN